jgi:hypothetical protein
MVDGREMLGFLVQAATVEYPKVVADLRAAWRDLDAVRGQLAFTEVALAGAVRQLGGEPDADALLALDSGEG